ncbi:MAG: GNAT family N-acetyltransferase [Phycisphaerales bacterium]
MDHARVFAFPLPPGVTLRPATEADIPQILALVRELAEYEREPDQAKATPQQIRRALFGDPTRDGRGAGVAECVMGEIEGNVQGMALFFMNFSTWTGQPGIYLEDLFVRPASRGRGLGKALLTQLARIAVSRGCTRFEWSVLDWNTPAIEFYKHLGAVPMSEWTVHRLAGEQLARLAGD